MAAIVMLAGVIAVGRHDGAARHQVETGPRPPAVRDLIPDPRASTVEGPAIPVPGGGTSSAVTAPSHAPSPATTSTVAPVPPLPVEVTFDQPIPDGRFRSAILRPGGHQTIPLSVPTLQASDPAPAVAHQYPKLSPDGTTVIYHSPRENVVGLGGVRTVYDLYSVSADGGPAHQLTDLGLAEGGGAQWPTWSPDGSLVMFNCNAPAGTSALCTMRPDGTDQRQVVTSAHQLILPSWSPDGRSIAAIEDDHVAGNSSLWVGPADGSTAPRRVPSPAFLRIDHAPIWSADGSHLLLMTTATSGADRGRRGHIVSIEVATGQLRQVPGLPLLTSMASCGANRLVIVPAEPFRSAMAGDVVAVDIDGGRPQVLLSGPATRGLLASDCHTMG